MLVIPERSTWRDPHSDTELTVTEEVGDDTYVTVSDGEKTLTVPRDHFESYEKVSDPRPSCPECGTPHSEFHVKQGNRCIRCRARLSPRHVQEADR